MVQKCLFSYVPEFFVFNLKCLFSDVSKFDCPSQKSRLKECPLKKCLLKFEWWKKSLFHDDNKSRITNHESRITNHESLTQRGISYPSFFFQSRITNHESLTQRNKFPIFFLNHESQITNSKRNMPSILFSQSCITNHGFEPQGQDWNVWGRGIWRRRKCFPDRPRHRSLAPLRQLPKKAYFLNSPLRLGASHSRYPFKCKNQKY